MSRRAVARMAGLAAAFVSSVVLLTTGAVAAGTGATTRQLGAVAGISVFFKLDPKLTQGLYMGDRWVSPPTYSQVGEGATVTVDARARGVDGRGMWVELRPEWRAEDPEMVTVTAGQGNQVRITILRPGQSSLLVSYGDISRRLAIQAMTRNNAIVVEIAQK